MTAILHNLPRPRTIDERLYPSRGLTSNAEWDAEMDVPPPTDPHVLAELETLAYRKVEKSPEQNIEWMLREYEKNYIASAPQRWPGQERWQGRENEEMRLVRIMHPHAFMRRLRRAGVDARIHCDPYGRLWLNDFSRAGLIGITAWVIDEAAGCKIQKTVTSLQYPWGPEYSIMRFNSYNVPTKEKYRGWRTALMALIMAGVVTEREGERAFGPAEGEAAHLYRQVMKGLRGMRLGVRE